MRQNKLRKILNTIIFYVALILIWQIIYVLGTQTFKIWKEYSFPNIYDIFVRFVYLVSNGNLQKAVLYSMGRGMTGYVFACIVGCTLGLVLIKSERLRTYLRPLITGIQTLPSVCWVPFAILWFGLGNGAIIFVVVMGSALSIALSVESSIRNIEPLYMSVAGIMGAKGFKLIRKVVIPAAMPGLISGFRQGWSFAWRALMSGEVISSSIGLGYTLMLGRNLADINQVMLVMIVIIVIGIMMDKICFSLIENRVLRKRGNFQSH